MGDSGRERLLKEILQYINLVRGIDLTHYREATLVRKLDFRLQETRQESYGAYLAFLKAHPEELQRLLMAVTIKFSNFFRNPLVFELLESRILPELAAGFGFLRVWSIGCAFGQEPYSVAILARDLLGRERDRIDVDILGTDIDPASIARAVKGEYPESELLETKVRHLESSFKLIERKPVPSAAHERHYRISDDIKALVRFSTGDVMNAKTFKELSRGRFNLILCRNVLIYMDRVIQEEILCNLAKVLPENGYLVIGETETVPETQRSAFSRVFPGVRIFRRVRSAAENP